MADIADTMSQITASNVKTLRKSFGEKQEQFADRLGTSQGTVARWEKGSNPRHEALHQLAELAGVTSLEFTTTLISVARDAVSEFASAPVGSRPLMLSVNLPSEAALTAMFQGLLPIVAGEQDQEAAARRLAQLLPDALARTVFHSPAATGDPVAETSPVEGAQPHAPANHGTKR